MINQSLCAVWVQITDKTYYGNSIDDCCNQMKECPEHQEAFKLPDPVPRITEYPEKRMFCESTPGTVLSGQWHASYDSAVFKSQTGSSCS